MNNEYYVYLHRRATDNKVFYVGKGKGKRAHVKTRRNKYWNNTVSKHGIIIQIVYDGLSEQEAFDLEIDTIKEMKYHFESTLCNLTDGGEGISGYKPTDEVKLKHSVALKGKSKSPTHVLNAAAARVNRKHSEDTKSKISAAKKGVPQPQSQRLKCSLSMLGRDVSPETRNKIAKSLTKTEVFRLVSITGQEFVGTRQEIILNTELNKQNVSKLVLGKRNVIKGWSVAPLVKEQNE